MHSLDKAGPILAFLCNWAPYRCYMESVGKGQSLNSGVYPVRIKCAGRVDPSIVLHAFEKGASGVMVIGCMDQACQYGPGPQQTKRLLERIKGILRILGLESERFAALWVESRDQDKLLNEIHAFVERVHRLGVSPLAHDHTGESQNLLLGQLPKTIER